MPGKDPHKSKDSQPCTGGNPRQFLFKFTEKNFQRQTIDEQSFIVFNRLVRLLGDQLSNKITNIDVEGYVIMMRTVLKNCQYLNKSRNTFCLYIQLIQICMQIFQKSVSIQLSREICCEFLDIMHAYDYQGEGPEQFIKLQAKFAKINMSKQLTQPQTLLRISENHLVMPALWEIKYQNLISIIFRSFSQASNMQNILKAFMNIQGQKYIDSILKTIIRCVEAQDTKRYKNLLKLFSTIGQTTFDQSKNLSVLITKLLPCKNRLDFLYQIFIGLDLEKIFQPSYLYFICINVMDIIFTQRIINQKSIQILKLICKYLTIFKQIGKLPEEQKTIGLYNKVLSVLFTGRYIKQTLPDPKLKKIRGSELLRERLQRFDKQQSQKNFNFMQELKNQMELADIQQQLGTPANKTQEKVQMKLQPLKPQQISLISGFIKKIFGSFMNNKKIGSMIRTAYSANQSKVQQFFKLCKDNVAHVPSQILQLIFAIYIPLIYSSKQFDYLSTTSKQQSSLLKIIKLRMLENRIQAQNISSQNIYHSYYMPTFERLVSADGQNYDFLVLTILHQHIDDSQMLIKQLSDICIKKIQQNSPNKSSYFRCTLALISSILDMHHNIVIKLSYNKIKMHLSKLNNKFLVQDFLSLNQVKQNKLFLSSPRFQMSKDKQSQIRIIREFVNRLFARIGKLGDLINMGNGEENSYYYMILIQFCSLCPNKQSKLKIQSQQIQSIIKIRRNNKYSMGISIGNQLLETLKQMFQKKEAIKLNQLIITLHLLIKLQAILQDPQPGSLPNTNNTKMQQQQRQISQQTSKEMSAQKLSQISNQLCKLIKLIGSQPQLKTLKLINKSLQSKQQINFSQTSSSSINFLFDQIQGRKNQFKQQIKKFHIVKFYSEANSNQELTLLMTIKTTMRLLERIWEKLSPQYVNQQRQQVKSLRLLYDSKSCAQSQNQRKLILTFLKLRILALNSSLEDQNKLPLDQIKTMTKYLQQNHDEVAKLIVSQQNGQNITGIQNLFESKTKFIGYMLEQIVKSENQSLNERQINLLTLNLLKTLIDNHNKILQISKAFVFQKLKNSQVIPILIFNKTKAAVQTLRNLTKQKYPQLQTVQKGKIKRLFQKQQQKIVQQSKKVYIILSKMLTSVGDLKSDKQQAILKMIDDIFKLDDNTNIFVSIYIIREIMNIAPILKCMLDKGSINQLTEKLFGQLMVIKESYEGIIIETSDKGQNSLTISPIVNFFIQNFYTQFYIQNSALELTDKIVITNSNTSQQKQQGTLIKKQKNKKSHLACLLSQKKGTFKCLKCDMLRQLCINCSIVCHQNHPIIYIQSNPKSKSCQCSQQNCKINPIYDKKKQINQKIREQRYKGPTQQLRQPNRAYIQQFSQRQYIRNLNEDQLDEEEGWNFFFNSTGAGRREPPPNGSLIQGTTYLGRNAEGSHFDIPPSIPSMGSGFAIPISNPHYQPYAVTSSISQPIQQYQRTYQSSLNQVQVGLQSQGLRNAYPPYYAQRSSENQFANFIALREQRQRQRQRRERQIIKQKQRSRQRSRQNERQQMRSFINESKYGISEIPEKLVQKVQYIPESLDLLQQEDQAKDAFEDEDYQNTAKFISNAKLSIKQKQNQENKSVRQLTSPHSYLLPIFMNMTVQLCESKSDSSKDKQPQINWHIKLANPIILNPTIVYTTSKMCAPRTYITKLAKSEGSFHPSPCVSRAPFAVSDKFLFILSGPKICVHLKQQIFSYLIDKNGTTIAYPLATQQHLQFEAHSISVGFKNYLCVAGLHQINLFQFEHHGQFTNRNSPLRHTINNDNINKIKMNKYGIFVGLSRQVRLITHSFQAKLSFKIPDALIKQWSVVQNNSQTFTLYVTCSEGYIFYAEANSNSSGQINLIKKINDSRTNRPVGSFVLCKNIEGCGNLLLSTFKDKNIGHSLGRLSSQSTLADLNYIKLFNQGIDPLFQKYYIMGLSDIAIVEKQEKPKQLFIVTLFKEDKNDIMAVHRGILAIIRIRQNATSGFSQYETQLITGEQQRCEYFQIVWTQDKKSWFILSLCQDGGLRVTVPHKITKVSLQKQLIALRDKKSIKNQKSQQSQKQKNQWQSKNQNQSVQLAQKLATSIKQHINIKTIKQQLSKNKMETNQFLTFIQGSQILKIKDDYHISTLSGPTQAKNKQYQIKIINRKKIITGVSFLDCSQVILPTRKIQATFQVGFTHEEALYFYAFGGLKFQVRKLEDVKYSRDIKKMSMFGRRELDYGLQQKIMLGMNPPGYKSASQISVLGQNFETTFKPKVGQLMNKIQKYMKANNPFDLTYQQKIQIGLKNCNLFLSNSILQNNITASQQQAEGFAESIRDWLVINKQQQSICNRLYPWVKKVLYKSLRLKQLIKQQKMHVFNDGYHPLHFATETKIRALYDSLSKGEINDQDYILLVNELYGFACGSLQQEVGAVNQQPEIPVLLSFLAEYPAMLYKMHKKIKILENAKILYRIIPLYLIGYVALKYLDYHLEWMLPAICQVVGKCVTSFQLNDISKPSILSRYIMYKYMKLVQQLKLEPWLKNINPVDAQQCLKEAPKLLTKNSLGSSLNANKPFGGLADFGFLQYGGGQQDEQAMYKRAIQQSQRQAERLDLQQPVQQQQNLMQQQLPSNISNFTKQLIQNCLKQIDYKVNSTQASCQKATVIYVIFKLALYDLQINSQASADTLQFLCSSIEKVIQKLCSGYQEFNNPNTHCILMMWLNLFGIIFKECRKDTRVSQFYQKVKQNVLAVLNKFKIEQVKKLANVPNLYARRIKTGKIMSKAHFIYGFMSVLQKPCEANFVLLTLGCYWLFPFDQNYYKKTKYIQTIRENQKAGNINKIYETAISNLDIWKEVGDAEWLGKWIQDQNDNWPKAIELLALYYE